MNYLKASFHLTKNKFFSREDNPDISPSLLVKKYKINSHVGEKYLKKSIKSIISQNYKNWELIFWNNCSIDNSKKIFKSFKDKRFRYFESKKFQKLYMLK